MNDRSTCKVVFQPMGRRVAARPGASLMDLAREAGVELEAACAGKGLCGRCRVKVQGEATPPGPAERDLLGPGLGDGLRLACQCEMPQGGEVWVPEESRRQEQVILTELLDNPMPWDPAVRVAWLKLEPSLAGNQERLYREITGQLSVQAGERAPVAWDLPLELLAGLAIPPDGICGALWRYDGSVLALEPGPPGPCLGLAVDLGTTTVAAYLLDLSTGELLAVEAAMNPQVALGEDVISRIRLCSQGTAALAEMQGLACQCINLLATKACASAGADPSRIFDCTLVGNTAMHHIVLGLDPGGLALAPYEPQVTESQDLPARDIGLELAPRAWLHLLPVKAGFVGADLMAVALALDAEAISEPTLIADLGTNGEMALLAGGRMLCCSTAAGPAFEGGHISCGMRGAPGAVEGVRLSAEALNPELKVIGHGKPLGLCGSGLVSLVSRLVAAGAVRPEGGFDAERAGARLREGGLGPEFLLAPGGQTASGQDLVLTAKDISELQLAKSALHAGAALMMREVGLERVGSVLLAGAFGNYLDPVDACGIGLFPGVTPDMITGVGNAAGAGAVMALPSLEARAKAQGLADRFSYLELSGHPEFNEAFVQGMYFPEKEE
ncbi:MAG: ASKHA domain-containing protein [Desulfarculaceae bacterium]|nr:ASKHA domain-containing protein [Desulfarculaceae bacterium]